MHDLIPDTLKFNVAGNLMAFAEDYAAVLAELGDHSRAVRLLGAADAMHERLGTPRNPGQQGNIDEPIAKTRIALTDQHWNDEYQAGRDATVEDVLTRLHTNDATTANLGVNRPV
jgi:hypothetical protein